MTSRTTFPKAANSRRFRRSLYRRLQARRDCTSRTRSLAMESLEQRMMLASVITWFEGKILLTDPTGTENDVHMDYSAGTLTISDNSGLNGVDALASYVDGNTLTMTNEDITTEGVEAINLDTGNGADTINVDGTPDPNARDFFNGTTVVDAGAGEDVIEVNATTAETTTTINGGENTDTITIGDGSLGGILGAILVNGNDHDAGTTSLTIGSCLGDETNTLDSGDILNINDQDDSGNTCTN